MALDDTLASVADKWLGTTGKDAVYTSNRTGLSAPIRATLEKAVASVDELGTVTSGMVVTVRESDVERLDRDDIFDMDGKSYRVDAVLDSGGYLLRCYVSEVYR